MQMLLNPPQEIRWMVLFIEMTSTLLILFLSSRVSSLPSTGNWESPSSVCWLCAGACATAAELWRLCRCSSALPVLTRPTGLRHRHPKTLHVSATLCLCSSFSLWRSNCSSSRCFRRSSSPGSPSHRRWRITWWPISRYKPQLFSHPRVRHRATHTPCSLQRRKRHLTRWGHI